MTNRPTTTTTDRSGPARSVGAGSPSLGPLQSALAEASRISDALQQRAIRAPALRSAAQGPAPPGSAAHPRSLRAARLRPPAPAPARRGPPTGGRSAARPACTPAWIARHREQRPEVPHRLDRHRDRPDALRRQPRQQRRHAVPPSRRSRPPAARPPRPPPPWGARAATVRHIERFGRVRARGATAAPGAHGSPPGGSDCAKRQELVPRVRIDAAAGPPRAAARPTSASVGGSS